MKISVSNLFNYFPVSGDSKQIGHFVVGTTQKYHFFTPPLITCQWKTMLFRYISSNVLLDSISLCHTQTHTQTMSGVASWEGGTGAGQPSLFDLFYEEFLAEFMSSTDPNKTSQVQSVPYHNICSITGCSLNIVFFPYPFAPLISCLNLYEVTGQGLLDTMYIAE